MMLCSRQSAAVSAAGSQLLGVTSGNFEGTAQLVSGSCQEEQIQVPAVE
jgi:hypothetical protein